METTRHNALLRVWRINERKMEYLSNEIHISIEEGDVLMTRIRNIKEHNSIMFFEGDILQTESGARFYIKYNAKTLSYVGVFVNQHSGISGSDWYSEEFTLVGNIYEDIDQLL